MMCFSRERILGEGVGLGSMPVEIAQTVRM
jgi:hypothetical protein